MSIGGSRAMSCQERRKMRRVTLLVSAIGVVVLLVCGVALAAEFDGTPEADTIVGTPNPDEIRGDFGNDRLIGGGGPDTLRTDDPGTDTVVAGTGNDVVEAQGDAGVDTIDCGDGTDTVDFDAGVDVVA